MTNETNKDEPKEVVSRLRPSELAKMKAETGAERDGSAVAAYCRLNLNRSKVEG